MLSPVSARQPLNTSPESLRLMIFFLLLLLLLWCFTYTVPATASDAAAFTANTVAANPASANGATATTNIAAAASTDR